MNRSFSNNPLLTTLRTVTRRVRVVAGLAAEFHIGRLGFSVLIAGSVLSGVAEAAVLALVAYVATSMSRVDSVANADLGPFSLEQFGISSLLGIALVLAVTRLLLQLSLSYLPARMTADLQTSLRMRLAGGFVRASWQAQSTIREGVFEQALSQQAARAASTVLSVTTGTASVCIFLSLVASAFFVSPLAASLAVLSASILFLLLRPISRATRREAGSVSRVSAELSQETTELVRLAEEVHTFGVGASRMLGIQETVQRLSGHFFRTRLYLGATAPLYQASVLALMIGGLAAINAFDARSIAALGAVVLMLIRALAYSQNVQTSYQAVSELLPSVELVRSEMKYLERNTAESEDGDTFTDLEEIGFHDVSFGYAPDRPILKEINLRIGGGESVGVIGPSGAGKSTLVQLLVRLREATAGQVTVNGVPAGKFSRSSWFDRLGFVPQEARVFAGTVSENIRFLRPSISDEDVTRAAQMASIHQEICEMPDGYETVIGQRTDAVSVGQRQRIALARALAGRPALLVLDEPTSSLDLRSEAAVTLALRSLRGRTTLVLVTHRLSTLRTCDRVLVFDEGGLSAVGTAEELLKQSPFFRQIVTLSSEGGQLADD